MLARRPRPREVGHERLGRDGAGPLARRDFWFSRRVGGVGPDVWASTAATSGAGSALKAPVKAFQDLLNGSGGQLAILLAVCVGAGAAAFAGLNRGIVMAILGTGGVVGHGVSATRTISGVSALL